jgi:hypothetical protein
MNWINVDSQEIAPRCYNLGDTLQRNEFIEDFKISAAISILVEVCLHFPSPIDLTSP